MNSLLTFLLVTLFCFVLPMSELRAEIAGEEFNNFITYYYLNSQPDKAPLVLSKFISSDLFKSNQTADIYGMQSYIFGRIAQMEPKLIPEYMNIFNETTHEGRIFLLMIFQICGNQQVKEFLQTKLEDEKFVNERRDIKNVLEGGVPVNFNPLKRGIKDGADLDYLWAEFFVTGAK